LFDGGMHVPAMLRAPGFVQAGQVWNRPMISMDLLPTFVKMAGGTSPAGIDGTDILPVLRGRVAPHEYIFWSFNNQRAVRQGDWKLVINPPSFPGDEVTDRIWLSNLEADPGERRNLAGVEPGRVAALAEKVREWEREMKLSAAQ
jgi:arylsulfatase A